MALWPEVPTQRCTVHKHRNLLAHAPDQLHEEISADYTDMTYAATPKEMEERRKAFRDIFPTEDAIARLIGAILLEHNDRWAVQRARLLSWKPWLLPSDIQSSACTPPQPDTPGQARRRTRTLTAVLHQCLGYDRRRKRRCAENPSGCA